MNGLEERISVHYNELPDQLKLAANFVMSHPFEVATRSMRSVAAISKLSPATYTRLARATGFHDYDELKTLCVDAVNHEKELSIHDRAERLQHDAHGSAGHFLFKQASASIQNVENLVQSLDTQKLDQIVEMLLGAKRVAVAGALASHGVAQYMAYLGSWCQPNWYLLAYDSHASGLYARDLTADDTVLMLRLRWRR